MLKKNTQQKYLDHELGSLKKLLSGIKKNSPGKMQIHDLRVGIKKIFALLELNKIRSYDPGNIHQLHVKELFRHAGSIRSSQIILEKLKKTGLKDKDIRDYLERMIHIQTELLTGSIPQQLQMLETYRQQIATNYLYDLHNQEIILYHHLKSQFLKTIFTDPLQPHLLHEGRKQIKHLLYISKLFSPTLKKKFPVNLRKMDMLQHLIGEWHDNVALLEFLEQMGPGTDKKTAFKVEQKMNKQFEGICRFLSEKNIFQ